MGWTDSVVTLDGVSLVTELITGGKLTITRAEISENTVSATALAMQKTILSPVSVPVTLAGIKEKDGSVNVGVQIRNTGAASEHTMRQLGLYAKTGTTGEKLFAILQNEVGETIPTASENPNFLLDFTAIIPISHIDNVSVTADPASVIVTKDALDDALEDKADKSEIPTTLPANGGNAATVGGHTVGKDVPSDAVFTDTKYTAASSVPKANGTAAVGTSVKYAREDHIHPQQTSVSGSSGSCTGNAASATKATNDSAGQQINTTYIKGLSASGTTITYTKGDGTTGTATVQDNSKMDKNNPTGTGAFSMGRLADSTVGTSSHAEGTQVTASATNTHAEGYKTIASQDQAHAEGRETTASSYQTHAEGIYSVASGAQSHAEGSNTIASGAQSHAEGTFAPKDTSQSLAAKLTTASGVGAHAEGVGTEAVGEGSHSEGCRSVATGKNSHAEGFINISLADYSHTEGFCSTTHANAAAAHAEGYQTAANGAYSHAEGRGTVASGTSSHAEGDTAAANAEQSLAEQATTASGDYSHAEGLGTVAQGVGSHVEGNRTTTVGAASHAEGYLTTANGPNSHAEGKQSTANHNNSHAENSYTYAAGASSHAQGCAAYARYDYASAGGFGTITNAKSDTVVGQLNNFKANQSLFTVGNGEIGKEDCSAHPELSGKEFNDYVRDNATSLSNAFRVDADGNVYALSTTINGGADYAEFIKPWFDDNSENEDRRGYFVTVKDGKLRKANPNDYIVGITSGNPSVVGNGDEDWLGRWKRDEFNELIHVEVEVDDFEERVGEDGKTKFVKVGSHTEKRRVQNPDYDPSQPYIERKDRPEWSYVGMVGVLPLRDDGTCVAGGFARCGAGGVATKADSWECHKTFFVIERINEHIISVEMR